MSGEMTGMIVGGILLIYALPYVVAGAAAVGATVGAAKLAGAVIRHAAERSKRNAYETNFSSDQLRMMYGKMNTAISSRRGEEERLQRKRAEMIEKEAKQISELTNRMEALAKQAEAGNGSDQRDAAKREIESLRLQVDAHRQAIDAALNENLSRDLSAIAQQAHDESKKAIEDMQRLTEAQREMMDWQTQDARLAAQQQLYVKHAVQDAKQSVMMLERMNGSSDAERRIAEAYRRQIDRAQEQLEQGLLESALAISQDVITRCALESLNCAERYEEREITAGLLIGDLEALRGEMEHRRKVRFQLEGQDEESCEDLNEFSQEEYERVQLQVEEMLERVNRRQELGLTVEMLQVMHAQLRDTLRPGARFVMETAQKTMISYYEKLAELDIVADFMSEQGYEVDWGETVGGDLSEKMVIHFANETTGNTVAVSLDQDMSGAERQRMCMDLMMFYEDGEEVSEEEKQALRDALKHALTQHGLGGGLSCSGKVGSASDKTEYDEEERVRAAQPRKLFSRR